MTCGQVTAGSRDATRNDRGDGCHGVGPFRPPVDERIRTLISWLAEDGRQWIPLNIILTRKRSTHGPTDLEGVSRSKFRAISAVGSCQGGQFFQKNWNTRLGTTMTATYRSSRRWPSYSGEHRKLFCFARSTVDVGPMIKWTADDA